MRGYGVLYKARVFVLQSGICSLELRTSLTKAGDGAKCGAKFADTPHVIYVEVTGVRSEWKECTEIAVARASRLSIQTIINSDHNFDFT